MKAVSIVITENDIVVDGSLAVTPSDMLRMTVEGKAICSQAMTGLAYYDSQSVGQADVAVENRRGSDMNDVWVETVRSKRRIKKVEKDLQKFA